jgi:carbonic anhydrase
MADTRASRALSRRDLFRLTAAGVAAAAVGSNLLAGDPRAAVAQSPSTPQEALKALMDGNARFVDNRMTSFAEDLELIRQHNTEGQQPFAGLLSCADSRVPVEIVFDQTFGRLFVTRVAGNIATSEIIASLEYGAVVLGTKVIMVLGHGSCGAITAAISGKAVPGQISALYAPIRPALNEAGPNLDAATRANARIQASLLRESSPAIADLVKQGKLLVVAAVYDLATGKVTVLG